MAISAYSNLFLLAALCAFPAMGASAPARAIDQNRVHANYHDGEFDKVIKDLEGFLKSGKKCSPAESLFVEKHLAVVYAANPGTRELGRYHMFRMLDLAPGSDLLDMFVGEEVDAVFEKIRKEYTLRNGSKKIEPAPAAKAVAALPPAASQSASRPSAATGSTWAASAKPSRPAPRTALAAVQTKASWESTPAPAKSAKALVKAGEAPVKASWESVPTPAKAGDVPAKTGVATKASWESAPAPAKSSWDSFASAPAPDKGAASLSQSAFNLRAGGSAPDSRESPLEFHSGSAPAWKEPGLWIGGGAALAVVAITFFYSNSSTPGSGSKTYVVPANVPH